MRLLIKHVLVLGVLLALAGCAKVTDYFAGKSNAEPPAPLPALQATLDIKTLWTSRTGSGADKYYVKLMPALANGKIFSAARDGRVSAFDAARGQRLWETDIKTLIAGGVGSGAGLVLVGTNEAEVLALDENKGSVTWRVRVSSEVLSPPRVAQGVVVVRCVDGRLFGLNPGDGARIWVYDSAAPALTLRSTSAPLIVDDKVIAGFANGKLAAVSLQEGKLLWEAAIAEPRGRTELERLVDISGDPQEYAGVVYAASFQGRIAAVQADTGQLLWARDLSSHAGIAVDERYVYVTDAQSQVYALDRHDGRSLWKQDKLRARALSAPAALGEYVAVGDFEGYLHWMAREDGRFVARTRVDDSGIIATPVVSADTLYVNGKGGALAAFKVDTR
ncbi:MAG: outer membrane protein assembly factor BamB [Gammaproteobacteria bacterium]|nr:outer membrane protein assembly factor BamB [Gammaproteobacteria bacterium]